MKLNGEMLARATTPGILSTLEYRRFWLTYDRGTIRVGRGGKASPFMQWHDEARRVNVRYIGIASFNVAKPLSWIFYTYCDE